MPPSESKEEWWMPDARNYNQYSETLSHYTARLLAEHRKMVIEEIKELARTTMGHIPDGRLIL